VDVELDWHSLQADLIGTSRRLNRLEADPLVECMALHTPERASPCGAAGGPSKSAGPADQRSSIIAAMTDELSPGDWFVPAPRAEAGWLLLRRPEPGDSGVLYEAVATSADHLRPWMPWATDYTVEMAHDFVNRNIVQPGNPPVPEASYLAWDRDRHLLGVCGLHARIGPGALEIGYWVDVRRTRRGVATLAAAALTELALGTPGVQVVEIHHDRANQASGAIPARLGYELVASVDDAVEAPGEVGVELQWRMTLFGWQVSDGARLLEAARRAAS
jgi:ribosomal-protein-serine acetyltransferase